MELRAGPEAAGARLDAFLAGPLGSRSRAQRLIEAGAVLVDGAAAPKRLRLAGGEAIAVDEAQDPQARGGAVATGRAAPFAVAYEDEHLLVIDKPAGVVVHPARGHAQGTLSQALEGRAAGGEAGRAGDRAPPGPPTRPGCWSSPATRRCTAPCARRWPDARSRASTSPWSRGVRRRAAARSTRRSAATAGTARASRPTATSRARRSPTSPSRRRCPPRRCCACAWRPGARTRSGPTCWPSATPSRATPSTARRGCWACGASSCTPRAWPSRTPSRGEPVDVTSPLPDDLRAALGACVHCRVTNSSTPHGP